MRPELGERELRDAYSYKRAAKDNQDYMLASHVPKKNVFLCLDGTCGTLRVIKLSFFVRDHFNHFFQWSLCHSHPWCLLIFPTVFSVCHRASRDFCLIRTLHVISQVRMIL